jgi:hypothetical protein
VLDREVYDYTLNGELEEVHDQFHTAKNGHLQDRAILLGWPHPVFVDRPAVNAFSSPGGDPKIIGMLAIRRM